MIDLGSNRVSKIMAGTATVYQDSDGWIPLELPDGVSGTVFFKDNGDGVASLVGAAALPSTMIVNSKYLLLNPPKGYAFISDSWHAGADDKGIYATPGYTTSSLNFSTQFVAYSSYSDGSLYVQN